jgi:5-methylcytosine-specific restriction endonuclease McrA
MTSRENVIQRAHGCCEYCLLPQEYSDFLHEVDHIISLKHFGKTVLENLALACFW